jgi:hypothetical protein
MYIAESKDFGIPVNQGNWNSKNRIFWRNKTGKLSTKKPLINKDEWFFVLKIYVIQDTIPPKI